MVNEDYLSAKPAGAQAYSASLDIPSADHSSAGPRSRLSPPRGQLRSGEAEFRHLGAARQSLTGGAVIKRARLRPTWANIAAAQVPESIEDYKAPLEDPAPGVDKDSILVLKGCGPKGYPDRPEVGNMALPPKLFAAGVRDMVRLSEARMSGTAFGTVILHVAQEADAGGPRAVVQNGDEIEFDGRGRLTLCTSDEGLQLRLSAWQAPPARASRGYAKLYIEHVLQADRGVELDFQVDASGAGVTRESH